MAVLYLTFSLHWSRHVLNSWHYSIYILTVCPSHRPKNSKLCGGPARSIPRRKKSDIPCLPNQSSSMRTMCFKLSTRCCAPSRSKGVRLLAPRRSSACPAPEKVRHSLFAESVFFDANDVLQVKYEMLRSIQVEGGSIAGAAEEFGLSRPTGYEAQAP